MASIHGLMVKTHEDLLFLSDHLLCIFKVTLLCKFYLYTGSEKSLTLHDGTVRDVTFLSTDQLLSAGAGDCTVCLTDIASGNWKEYIR